MRNDSNATLTWPNGDRYEGGFCDNLIEVGRVPLFTLLFYREKESIFMQVEINILVNGKLLKDMESQLTCTK